MKRPQPRKRAGARKLRFEPLEIRALLTTGLAEAPVPTDILEIRRITPAEQRLADLKASLSDQRVVGLEDHVVSDLLDVYRNYAAAYSSPNAGADPEAFAAATALPADSLLWAQSSESRIGIRVVAAEIAAFSDTLSSLNDLGYEEFASEPSYLLSEGSLPVWALPAAAEITGVAALDAMYDPIVYSGSVQTQADAKMNADDVRNSPGAYTGAGVKVGVISDSASMLGGGIAAGQATGDLPANVEILRDGPSGSSDEGRGMMELVHDIAPGASLAFRSAFWGELDFARGIHELAAAGADIIVDDIFYYAEPAFADGPIAQAVNHVVNTHGVAYFSSAGNHADHSYESLFRDNSPGTWGTAVNPGSGPNLHDFDPGAGVDVTLRVNVTGSGFIPITLQWDQPWYTVGESASNFDLYVYNTSGGLVTFANRNNPVFRQPFEFLTVPAGTYDIQINHVSGPEAVRMKLMAFTNGRGFTVQEYTSDAGKGTVVGHAAAAGAAAIAAAPYSTYDTTGAIEAFSSRGQPTFYFDSEYRRLETPVTRNKPDFTAPDGGNTTFFGSDDGDVDFFPNFYGTSAAAPDAAAVGALLLQQRPALSPTQLYDALATTATDRGTSGWDRVYGAGNIDAFAASTALNTLSNFADLTGPLATEFSVQAYGVYPVDKFNVWFNEELNAAAAATPANYEIREAGADAQFGTGDDATVSLAFTYDDATRVVLIDPFSTLNQGRYRLTLKSGAAALRDLSGNSLNAGLDQIYDFEIGNLDRERILTQRELSMSWPDVAINSANQGVVVWADTTGFTDGIFVQRYDETGQPLGKSPLVLPGYSLTQSGETEKYTLLPSVAIAENGQFVVAYEGYTSNGSGNFRAAFAQRFNADGTLLGGPIRVDSAWSSNPTQQSSPDVAITPDGSKFVVVWEDGGISNPTRTIQGIVYNWNGTAATSVVTVNTTDLGTTDLTVPWRLEPAVSINTSGSWAVAWSRFDGANTHFTYVRRYDISGNAQTTEILVGSVGNHERDPDVAIDDNGNFNVAHGSVDVVVARYNAAGSLRETPFQVNTTTSSNQGSPAIAIERDSGDFVVAWRSFSQDIFGSWSVYARQYNNSAVAITSEFALNQTTQYHEAYPAVAMDTDGDIWAVWNGYQTFINVDHAIYGRWMPSWANTSLTDVTPLALEATRQVTPGENIDIKLTMYNPSFITSGTPSVRFYLSTDSAITTADQALGNVLSGTSLLPGQTGVANFTVPIPKGLALASAYLGVIVDPNGTISESNEFNNTASQPIQLRYTSRTSGAETRVNSTTTLDQVSPYVAMDDSGRIVVTWSGNGPGDSSGVFLQRYNALGQSQGSEFRANTAVTNTQTDAVVAMNKSTGDYVVAWTSDQVTSNNFDIYFQRFNSSGLAQGLETRANTTTTGNQLDPTIAMDDSGNFVIAWTAEGTLDRIFARRYDSGGAAQGGEFTVDTILSVTFGSDQSSPSIAMDSTGKFVVAYQSTFDEPNGTSSGVYFQRFDASGNRVASQTHANFYTSNNQTRPVVALADDGKVVVVWVSSGQEQFATSESANNGIYLQRFDANNLILSADYSGTFDSKDIRVNPYVKGDQLLPSVAVGSDGRVVIAWDSDSQDSDGRGVYFRKYNADGSPDGGMRRVNTEITSHQFNPVVAVGSGDAMAIVWQSTRQDGSGEGIYAQRFGVEGGAIARTEDFESQDLSSGYWETYSTSEGRIQLTSNYEPRSTIDLDFEDEFRHLTIQNGYGGAYQLVLDDTVDNSTFSLNEAVWYVNLALASNAFFTFWEKVGDTVGGNGDEFHPMSSTFSGHENSDGIAISNDGITWYRVWSEASTPTYTRHSFKLNDIVQSIQIVNPSFVLTNATRIKFQQYDNSPAIKDGLMFDEVQLVVPKIWDGGGSTYDWSDAANWVGDTVPQATDHVLFNDTSVKDSLMDSAFAGTLHDLTIEAGFTGYIFHLRPLTITTGGTFFQADGGFTSSGFPMNFGGTFTRTGGFFGPGSSTVTFTGGNLGAATSIASGDTVIVTGNLILSDGLLKGGTMEVRGNVTAGATFDAGSTTALKLNGTGTQTLNLSSSGVFDGDITIDKTAGQVNLTSALTMDAPGQDLTIASSTSVLQLNANNLAVTGGAFSNNGTVRLQGINSQAINLTQDTDSGTWEYLGDGDSVADTFTLKDFGPVDYYQLKISATDGLDTFQSAANSPKVIAGAYTQNSGGFDVNSNSVSVGSMSGGGATSNISLGSGTLTTGTDNTHTNYFGALSGSGGLSKTGQGSFYLRTSSTYDGPTTITDGSILVSTNNGLGTATSGTTVQAGAMGRLVFERSVNYTTPEPVTINGHGFNGAGSLIGVGNSTFAGPVTLASASTIASNPAGYTFTLNGSITTNGFATTVKGGGHTTINGVISGAASLTKEGTGTLVLSNTNTYDGATTVNGGTLHVTGSTASSATTVNANAILSGTGTVGSINASGGTVSPGTTAAVGPLAGSSANFSGDGILKIRVRGYGTAGSAFDQLNLTGALTIGGTSKLVLDLTGLATTGVASGIVVSNGQSGAFATVDLLNKPNNYQVCLTYTGNAINVSIQTGACGQWTTSANEVGATGLLTPELSKLRSLSSRAEAVVVASLDTGVDYVHPTLARNVWINDAEIPSSVRSRLKDTDGDKRITLRDLNANANQNSHRVSDINKNGLIDGADLLAAWSDGIDADGNGYVDDLIGWDFVNSDNNPFDDSGHGTHAAGILAQLAPKVEIMPLKFLDASAGGSLANAGRALDYALAKKVPLSSNGWAASVFAPEWLDSIKKAEAAGHVFVTAAGNGDPALVAILNQLNRSNVLVVTAVDSNGRLPTFANWDPAIVDVAAPGVGVVSAVPGGGYAAASGTSVSTAYAAGIAALLQGIDPKLVRADVIDAVIGGAASNPTSRGGPREFNDQLLLAVDAYYSALARQAQLQNNNSPHSTDASVSRLWRSLRGKSNRP